MTQLDLFAGLPEKPEKPLRVAATPARLTGLFNIAPQNSFVDVFARTLTKIFAGDAVHLLARELVLLPNRRAVRSLREAFLRNSGGTPMLLPQMVPVGDLAGDDVLFRLSGLQKADRNTLDTHGRLFAAEPVVPLMRKLLLARLVEENAKDNTIFPEQSVKLAEALADLLDRTQAHGLDLANLQELVPEDYAAHWGKTLEFLQILTRQWPKIKAEKGFADPAEYNAAMLGAQVALWQNNPPAHGVYALGIAPVQPAIMALLKTVAGLPYGTIVFDGLDMHTNDESWQQLDETHPQFMYARLLSYLEAGRENVKSWPAAHAIKRTPQATDRSQRAKLISQALCPAATTSDWQSRLKNTSPQVLNNVTRIDCATPHSEALTIALVLRSVLENPQQTAALVTPDRNLARRVIAHMQRWGIGLDDSAGRPLDKTPVGTFLKLAAACVANAFAPADILALLKHPLAACGIAPADCRAWARFLEKAALRGPRPAAGLAALRSAFEKSDEYGKLDNSQIEQVENWLDNLAQMTASFENLCNHDDGAGFARFLQAHMEMCEALATTDNQDGALRLWAKEDGVAASDFAAELAEYAQSYGQRAMNAAHYLAMFFSMAGSVTVRPRFGLHPRLAVLGPMEARLVQKDVMVLGGLNEGTWPPESIVDPWMSRPMAKRFGLPSAEERIGLAAHDFYRAFMAPRVFITRANRVDGSPTVPSRWLLRLDAVLSAAGMDTKKPWGDWHAPQWADWAAKTDTPDAFVTIDAPAPCPPVKARPRQLPVTQVETWMRDPYGLYAYKILGLKKLDPVDADPGVAQFGTIVHDILEQFSRQYPAGTVDDAKNKLLETAREVFEENVLSPGLYAFWWPRFARIADWFTKTDGARRAQGAVIHSEQSGAHSFTTKAGRFTITAKADRIETHSGDDGCAVIDYKTGAPPSAVQVAAGYAPQLPLEAGIVAHGGFAGIQTPKVKEMQYWRLTGRGDGGEIKDAVAKKLSADVLGQQALEGLAALVNRFDDESTPYMSRPIPDKAPTYSNYVHLARVAEWSTTEDGEDG